MQRQRRLSFWTHANPIHTRRCGQCAIGFYGHFKALLLHSPDQSAIELQQRFAARTPQNYDGTNVGYDGKLAFVRLRYAAGFSGFGRRGGRELPWAHDYPTADVHMMKILDELTTVGPHVDGSNIYSLDDPDLMNHPIAYMSEPGFWSLSDAETQGLRTYLPQYTHIIPDLSESVHFGKIHLTSRDGGVAAEVLIPLNLSTF